MTAQVSTKMRDTWDVLARKNAMHYIATERAEWNLDDFLSSGRTLVRDLFAALDYHPQGTALDLGCGIGRLSFALAAHCERVYGVDVSGEMIARAQHLREALQVTNVEFFHNNGLDFRFVASDSCDLGFSYVVLQHLPDSQAVVRYVHELGRVVKPGGHVLFQVPIYRHSPLVRPWRAVQRLFRLGLGPLESRGLVPPEKSTAFRGSRLTRRQLESALAASGLELIAAPLRASTYRFCQDALVFAVKRKPPVTDGA